MSNSFPFIAGLDHQALLNALQAAKDANTGQGAGPSAQGLPESDSTSMLMAMNGGLLPFHPPGFGLPTTLPGLAGFGLPPFSNTPPPGLFPDLAPASGTPPPFLDSKLSAIIPDPERAIDLFLGGGLPPLPPVPGAKAKGKGKKRPDPSDTEDEDGPSGRARPKPAPDSPDAAKDDTTKAGAPKPAPNRRKKKPAGVPGPAAAGATAPAAASTPPGTATRRREKKPSVSPSDSEGAVERGSDESESEPDAGAIVDGADGDGDFEAELKNMSDSDYEGNLSDDSDFKLPRRGGGQKSSRARSRRKKRRASEPAEEDDGAYEEDYLRRKRPCAPVPRPKPDPNRDLGVLNGKAPSDKSVIGVQWNGQSSAWQVRRTLAGKPRWPTGGYHKLMVPAAVHHDIWMLKGGGLHPPITPQEARDRGLNYDLGVHKDPEVEALLEGTNRETAFSLYNIRGRAQYPLKREDGAGGTDPEGGGAGTGAEDSAGGKATPKKRRRRTKKELAFAAAVAAATAEFEAKGEDEEADAGEGGAGARGEAAAPAEAPAAAAEEEDEGAQARGKTGASPAPAARKTAARAKAATSPAPRKALGPAAHAAEEAARAEGGTGAGAGAGPPTRDEDLEDEAAAIAALAGAADAEETELGQRGTGDVVDTDGEGNGEKNAKNANAKKKNRGAAGAAAILDEKPEVPATGEPSAPCEPDRRPEGVEYIGFRISAGFGAAAAKASWQVVRCLRGLPRWPKNAYHKDKVSAAIHHDKWLLGGAGLDPPITRTEARAKGLNFDLGVHSDPEVALMLSGTDPDTAFTKFRSKGVARRRGAAAKPKEPREAQGTRSRPRAKRRAGKSSDTEEEEARERAATIGESSDEERKREEEERPKPKRRARAKEKPEPAPVPVAGPPGLNMTAGLVTGGAAAQRAVAELPKPCGQDEQFTEPATRSALLGAIGGWMERLPRKMFTEMDGPREFRLRFKSLRRRLDRSPHAHEAQEMCRSLNGVLSDHASGLTADLATICVMELVNHKLRDEAPAEDDEEEEEEGGAGAEDEGGAVEGAPVDGHEGEAQGLAEPVALEDVEKPESDAME